MNLVKLLRSLNIEDKPSDKSVSTLDKIEVIRNINPKSIDFVDLRDKMICLAKSLYDKVHSDDNSKPKDIIPVIKAIKDVLEFESKDRYSVLSMVSNLPDEKKAILEKLLEPDKSFATLDKQAKIDKDAGDIFG